MMMKTGPALQLGPASTKVRSTLPAMSISSSRKVTIYPMCHDDEDGPAGTFYPHWPS